MRTPQVFIIAAVTLSLGGFAAAGTPAPEHAERPLPQCLSGLDRSSIRTGILYDLVVPLSHIDDHEGAEDSKLIGLKHWRQIYHEISRASLSEPSWPDLNHIRDQAKQQIEEGAIPIAIMNFKYNGIKPAALKDGSRLNLEDLVLETGLDLFCEKRVFAVAALKDYTHRGGSVVFTLGPAWYFTNDSAVPEEVGIDFDDGRGFRTVRPGEKCLVSYNCTGTKVIRLRCHFEDTTPLHGGFYFDVRQLQIPTPHDTLAVTATIPYQGEYATGEAYVYLGENHISLENPVLVVEGFDIDNTMNWEELYELMNQEGMIETLYTRGFDAVVLNFTDATDYIQRNSFVLVELIEQINDIVHPCADLAIIGASMGGLVARYALAYMETHALEHGARTFISFDAPHKGANIPLGIQYWVKFFSIESEDAAFLLERLGTAAPRQMLVYYFADPPTTTGQSDSLFTQLLADLEAVGQYPANLRKVAVANGSGHMQDQGFAPGGQIILYEYNSLLVDIIGNVWAVPQGTNHIIFDGLLDRIWPFPDDQMTVYVEGTRPYDSAPGGTRATMVQMDTTEAPYGDVIALHDSHCFIPTISALDLDTDSLFYDIAGDPDILAHTPFDTVYYPAENQEHVAITADSKDWFVDELERGLVAGNRAPQALPSELALEQSFPNPFSARSIIRFSVPDREHVRLEIFNVAGQHVATILDRSVQAGWRQASWDGMDEKGRQTPSGMYFCRLITKDACRVIRIVRLR